MRKVTILFLLITLSCTKNNQDNLELRIQTKELFVDSKVSRINVITYSITNNSNQPYYLNNQPGHIKIPESISKERKFLRVFTDLQECTYYPIFDKSSGSQLECSLLQDKQIKAESINLGYKELSLYKSLSLDKVNTFIFPNQTLYFEYFVCIDKFHPESNQATFAGIDYDSKKDYFCTLSIASDSINYKKNLPRDILKTIENNNVKVYHGILESSNKVPIKILK